MARSQPRPRHVHYITHFRYPSEGGFVSYLNKFVPMGNLNLNHELVSVDPRARRLRFSNGHEAHYDALISSVPLPDLIRMMTAHRAISSMPSGAWLAQPALSSTSV